MADAREDLVALLPQLRGFARSLSGGDNALADDLVQDTVVLALRAWHSFVPGTSLKSWLLKILHNRFHSLKRRKHLKMEVVREDLDLLSSVPAAQHGRIEVAAFKLAFARLKPEHREALVLTGVHGLSYEAVAGICGCRVGTVKSRVSRARTQLKDLLVGDEPGGGGEAAAAPRPVAAPVVRPPPRIVVAAPPPIVAVAASRPDPVAPAAFVLGCLADTERQIVRLELRLTRYEGIAGRLARARVDVAGAAALSDHARGNLADLQRRRQRLLDAWCPSGLAAAS